MKYQSLALLEDLQSDVRSILLQAQQLKKYSDTELRRVPSPGKWSVAQVLEHLNIYARYYTEVIEQALHLNQLGPVKEFKSGWLGNYFTNMMKPRTDQSIPNKMKTPKMARPAEQPDAQEQLEAFISSQHQLINLLQIAKGANLNAIRIPISLTKLIKLKLGDTFRFFIAHEQRHFVQIDTILQMR